MRALAFVVLLAGCEHDLVHELPDAPPPDAAIADVAQLGCPTPAMPLAPGRLQVFVNTEGLTLHKGNCDDARTDCTSLVAADDTVVPPFLPGDSGRVPFIDQIVSRAQGVLAPYSIDLVLTRPTTADYEMIVVGGDPVALTGSCQDCFSEAPYDGCDRQALSHHHLDLVFDRGSGPGATSYANTLLSEVAAIVGLVPTIVNSDCTCRVDATCGDHLGVCMFGVDVPTTMQGTPPYNCGKTTVDEPAELKAVLGCR